MQLVVRSFGQALMILEMLAATLLFGRKLPLRTRCGLRLTGAAACLAAAVLAMTWLKSMLLSVFDGPQFSETLFAVSYLMTMASEVVLFFLWIGLMSLVCRIRRRRSVFFTCAAYSVRSIARCLFTLYILATGASGNAISVSVFSVPANALIYLLAFAAVCAACYAVFLRRYQSGDEDYLSRANLAALLVLSLMNMALSAVNAPKNSPEAAHIYPFIILSRIFLCLTGLTMQFSLLRSMKLFFQNDQMSRLMEKQKAQYEIARQSMDTVNINAHDLRHQIAMILSAIRDKGNPGIAVAELDEMSRMVDAVDSAYHTGHQALDVVLTEKARACQAKGITFSAIADGKAAGFMSDMDTYTLFGNLLDNAIEASVAVAEPEGRVISLALRRDRGMVLLHVENTFAVPPVFVRGVLQTGKRDSRFHGFGVQSISRVAEKYGGSVSFRVERNLFQADVLFPGEEAV